MSACTSRSEPSDAPESMELAKRLVELTEAGLPLVDDPWAWLAERLGTSIEVTLELLQRLQTEAMRNMDDPIAEMMQRMWTSTLTLQGKEFCFILNRAVRGDEPPLADPTAGLSRGINKLCVSVPPRPPFPPGDVCLRGGGFDDRYRRCAAASLSRILLFVVRAAAPAFALSVVSFT